jgi:UDP-N-acetylmuramoyl-tripeptide--D-alanyl-D-alanine ligase
MKKIHLTLEDIFNIPSAVIYNPDNFKSVYHVSTNSRQIKRNCLFVAIKGEKFDGHDFIDQAVNKGASAILINQKFVKKIKNYDLPVITVKDTVIALGDLARIWRSKLNARVIGITGSAGKTTTKEILAKLLSRKFNVNKTKGNNNNHIGVPLTILSTSEKHQVLIAELGTNHFGEIEYTAKIASPNFGLITNIGDSHLEYLKHRKGVLKEKSSLIKYTLLNKGKVFINNDDELLKRYGSKIKSKITFSLKNKSDYKGSIISYDKYGKPIIEIISNKKSVRVKLPLSGEKNAINYLAAFAIASEMGVSKSEIIKATERIKSYDKRLSIKHYKKFTLINDTYNANPDSMKASLNILKQMESKKKKIAILGDMFELGKVAKMKHTELGGVINKLEIDEVYSIGKNMHFLDKTLNGRIKIHSYFKDRESLKKYLTQLDISNSVILVKGSRGMKMEEFVTIIQSRKN